MPLLWLIIGAIGGAAAMYILDPRMGNRRRALLRDQMVRARHESEDWLEGAGKDLRNRAQGAVATAPSSLSNEPVSDEILVARVRSQMGRVVTNTSAIDVRANNGTITLTGPILAEDHDKLLTTVRGVQGVTDVEDRLRLHKQRGDLPDIQVHSSSSHIDPY